MKESPFVSLLMQGETVLWSASGQAKPRSWSYSLALVAFGLALLAAFAPKLWTLVVACYQTGDLFPLKFAGLEGVLGTVLPVAMGVAVIRIGVSMMLQRQSPTYGLSASRAFLATTGQKAPWVTAGVVQTGGRIAISTQGGLTTLVIPIGHSGESDDTIEFERLSQADSKAAIALVNKMIGASAK